MEPILMKNIFFYLKPFFSWRLNLFPKSVPLAFLHPWMDFKFIFRICVFSGWLHWSMIERKKSTMAIAIIIMTFRLKTARILRCFRVIWCKNFHIHSHSIHLFKLINIWCVDPRPNAIPIDLFAIALVFMKLLDSVKFKQHSNLNFNSSL